MIIRLAVVVCALTALGAAASAQAQVVTNASVPFSLAVFVPCANGGAGETVQLDGTLQVIDLATFDDAGGLHLAAHSNPQGVSGVGLTTGTTYRATGVTLANLNLTAGVQSTFVDNFGLIGQGTAGDLQVHATFVFVFNADGTLTANVLRAGVTCA